MNKDRDKDGLENQRPKRELEALLLEGLESGKATAFTRADFDEIKKRGLARLKTKKTLKNSDPLFARSK